MEINTIIGNNLKKIRQEKKLTLDELAGITGVSKGMLSQIEKGTT
ncbi:helix-turn-helix transcriptional regulator, partial [Enterococcus faecalis]|nr:helix-turn-helix transcriptional regulator [Enterococcus faecalis]